MCINFLLEIQIQKVWAGDCLFLFLFAAKDKSLAFLLRLSGREDIYLP
jgi:hypothetical protein